MELQVVGAGVGRTGTLSLKTGLEQLTGSPCYHMLEVFGHPEHVALWRQAAEGATVDWAAMLDGYGATSDFPACLFWPEILEANPDAVVVLSTRRDSQAWWESASQTIFAIDGSTLPPRWPTGSRCGGPWPRPASPRDWTDQDAAIAAYDRHNAAVRASVPADRLVDWQAGDGWKPLCDGARCPGPRRAVPPPQHA